MCPITVSCNFFRTECNVMKIIFEFWRTDLPHRERCKNLPCFAFTLRWAKWCCFIQLIDVFSAFSTVQNRFWYVLQVRKNSLFMIIGPIWSDALLSKLLCIHIQWTGLLLYTLAVYVNVVIIMHNLWTWWASRPRNDLWLWWNAPFANYGNYVLNKLRMYLNWTRHYLCLKFTIGVYWKHFNMMI